MAQQPSPLVLIQVKLLDGHSFGPLAIGRLDRAQVFGLAADDDDAPASQGLSGIGRLGHGGKIMAAKREGESAQMARVCREHVAWSFWQRARAIENA